MATFLVPEPLAILVLTIDRLPPRGKYLERASLGREIPILSLRDVPKCGARESDRLL